MTDEEWEKHRNRTISLAFSTGRPIMGDSEGNLKYADTGEPVDVNATPKLTPKVSVIERKSWWQRFKDWIGE